MAEAATIHASAVRFGAHGILIRGAPGAGKSALAVALIEEGADLVADDRVILSTADGTLSAAVPATIAGMIELRGIGILRRPFISPAPIALCVDLVPLAEAPRLPEGDERRVALEGVELPRLALPIGVADGTLRVHVALREWVMG